jgi:hypothetical protein
MVADRGQAVGRLDACVEARGAARSEARVRARAVETTVRAARRAARRDVLTDPLFEVTAVAAGRRARAGGAYFPDARAVLAANASQTTRIVGGADRAKSICPPAPLAGLRAARRLVPWHAMVVRSGPRIGHAGFNGSIALVPRGDISAIDMRPGGQVDVWRAARRVPPDARVVIQIAAPLGAVRRRVRAQASQLGARSERHAEQGNGQWKQTAGRSHAGLLPRAGQRRERCVAPMGRQRCAPSLPVRSPDMPSSSGSAARAFQRAKIARLDAVPTDRRLRFRT